MVAVFNRINGAVLAKTKIAGEVAASPPRLIFTRLAGPSLDLRWQPPAEKYSGQCLLAGRRVDYAFPLRVANDVEHHLGGSMTQNLPAGKTRTYNFRNWRVTISQ